MREYRSGDRIVRSAVGIKQWLDGPPSVEAVRPAFCCGCGLASRPLGGRLVLHGHGLRDREVRGPLAAGEPSAWRVIRCRRYRCRVCRAVMLVVPAGVLRRRLFSAPAIALALLLWGLLREPSLMVRRQVSPWQVVGPSVEGWASLGRWSQAAATGGLFAGALVGPAAPRPQDVARQVASGLLGYSPPELRDAGPAVQVFAAGVRAP